MLPFNVASTAVDSIYNDDTDDEANVTNILLDLSQDGPDKAGKPPIRDCLCRDGNSSSGFAHSCALYKKITQ